MLFSVIVPVYKVEAYIRQCVESVLNQTFRDFELILVDDGSPDDCGRIIDEYAAMDSRVVAVHKANGGVTSARKAALAYVRGEYVVALDGDDWLENNALFLVAAAIQRHNSDIICFGYYRAKDEGKSRKPLTHREEIHDRAAVEKNILPRLMYANGQHVITQTLWGKAFSRNLYQKHQITVDNRICMGEDGAVVFPAACEMNSLCVLPECLYNYRIHAESITQRKIKPVSWDLTLLRIEHLIRSLPLDCYDMKRQLGCAIAHAVFVSICIQLSQNTYLKVKNDSLMRLDEELMNWIYCANYSGSLPEKLAQFALRRRWIWPIKLYSMLR